MLGAANYQARQQGGGAKQWGGTSSGFAGHMDPEDLFRKIFEEFSGGGGQRGGFEDYREYAPMEVRNICYSSLSLEWV